jgi:hypothetical protein
VMDRAGDPPAPFGDLPRVFPFSVSFSRFNASRLALYPSYYTASEASPVARIPERGRPPTAAFPLAASHQVFPEPVFDDTQCSLLPNRMKPCCICQIA